MAWPIVCPKLKIARLPFSYGSSATIPALNRRVSLIISSFIFFVPGSTCFTMFHNLSPHKSACLIISANPALISRCGRGSRNFGYETTACGKENAPTRFFIPSRSIPVFPPIDASAIERSVVGICMKSTPLR